MNRPTIGASVVLALAATAVPAAAHFQTIYAPSFLIEEPGEVPLKLIFWHPFIEGPNVDMPEPVEFYMVHRLQRTELMDRLERIVFQGPENPAVAYDASLPVERVGDYVVVLVTGLYYDDASGGYIQQFAKAILNFGDAPTDWFRTADIPATPADLDVLGEASFDEAAGLATEIVPLTKPYNVLAGSTFTGMLLREGAPLPFWQVEIVYLSAEPDMETNTIGETSVSPPPGGMLVVTTDEEGIFTVGVPRAGFWGFGALGSGPTTEAPDGQPLSQDAILWIEAHDLM